MLLCIDPKVIWGLVGNRILTIFDPYTFLHSQGQDLPVRR